MKKLLFVTICLCLIATLFCGCSFISGLFNKDKTTTLSTPTNLFFDEDSDTLVWNDVKNASGYEVKIVSGSGTITKKTSSCTLYLGDAPSGELKLSVKATSTGSKFKDSAYSSELVVNYVTPLDVDKDSVKFEYKNGALTISWKAVEHATAYDLTYNVDGKSSHIELSEPRFTLSLVAKKNCNITLFAKGTGAYKDGKKVRLVRIGIPDYEHPISFDKVDKKDPRTAVFYYGPISNAYIDNEEVAELVKLGENKFEIPEEYWENMTLGRHLIALVGAYEVETFTFDILDSRTPELVIGNYVKDGGDLVGTLIPYGNSIGSICKEYTPLPYSQGTISENTIILFSSYLDTLDEGELRLNISYVEPVGDKTQYLGFKVQISSEIAKLVETSYKYNSGDLHVNIKTNGDSITSVKAGSQVLTTADYIAGKNTLIIKKEFLKSNTYDSFTVTTAKGGVLNFTITNESDGFVPTKEVFDYDTSLGGDLIINGNSPTWTLNVFGNKIITTQYTVTNGKIILSSTYLKDLKAGYYTYTVYANNIPTTFKIKVYSSVGTVKNVKLNYDISATETYITFDCNCMTDKHTYKLDDSAYAPCTNGQLVSVDRKKSHTLTIKCDQYGKSSSYFINPTDKIKGYLNNRISINGISADTYIDSFEEFVFAMQYIVNGGDGIVVDADAPNGKVSLNCYLSKNFLDYVESHPSYFDDANSMLEISRPCSFSFSSTGNEGTIVVKFASNPNDIYSSGKTPDYIQDTTQYLTKGNRSSNFNGFAINSSAKTEQITTLFELEALTYGVKPTFLAGESYAKTVYEKALTVLRTYVRDDMSDTEKVMTIYHYLTSNVTYDTYTLSIYELKQKIQGVDLATARGYVNAVIEKYGKTIDLLEPLLSIGDMNTFTAKVSEICGGLATFSSYGALIDGVAVCDGIASAFKLMCLIEGIECIEVSGIGVTSTGRENHAWNKVKINDEWYVVDATWGRNDNYVNHRYFMISDLEASKNHLENYVGGSYSVIDIVASGAFDYYAWNVEPYANNDMVVNSREEFKTLVQLLQSHGETQCEIKLNYKFTDMKKEIEALNVTCRYVPYDNVVLIIFNNK